MHESDAREKEPAQARFTIATAVYNVSKYLGDFIESIERQSFDLSRVEVIMVDDGSTDDSLSLLHAWQRRRPELVTVLTKPNGGQGSARNMGIDHATAEWVTFIDPDDWVDDDYLTTVDRFIDSHPDVRLVGTYRIFVDEPMMVERDRHPLRSLFRAGDQLINMQSFPDFFHGSAPSAFVKRDLVNQQALRFDERVQPNFEDGHFCARYILDLEGPPMLGLLSTARYYYRKRGDQSSTLQNSLMDPRRFIDVPRYGYLGVLEYSRTGGREVPRWLKNMILYEISFYFSSDESATSAATAALDEVGREFVDILASIVDIIGEEAIHGFSMRNLKQQWIDVLLHGLRPVDWFTPYMVTRGFDHGRKQVLLGFLFTGPEPHPEYLRRGRTSLPRHEKIRSIEYFGQQLLFERLAWVSSSGTLSGRLDGHDVPLRKGYITTKTTSSIRPSKLEKWFGVEPPRPSLRFRRRLLTSARLRRDQYRATYSRPALEQRWMGRVAGWKSVSRVFGNSWILMDRIHDANDSAEVLFHALRRDHPDVNAWFVLKRDTPDWVRLRPLAGRRLLAHGSWRWKLAMMHCRHLISSHVDQPIRLPAAITSLRSPDWRFTFLQHGVIKDDLSRWLNGKSLDLFVTSTVDEHESIVGDYTPYVYTTKEVKMTGLPRFDALTAAAERVGGREPDLILVAPTWRQWLTQLGADGADDERRDTFARSEFAIQWRDVLTSDRLRKVADEAGLTVAFLPHPNIRPAVPFFDLDPGVPVIEYAQPDLHDYFARSALLITDYSSMAFNAAYLERPVVYFQFDAEQVEAGGHLGRRGYFDYDRDGFGPVVDQADDVVAAVESIVAGSLDPRYRERMSSTFPVRDGNCSDRVIEEIKLLR